MNARFTPPTRRRASRDTVGMPAATLSCPLCGQPHRPVWLAPGERAHCVRCDHTLARGSRSEHAHSARAFALAGLLLAAPALTLPFVTVGKLGNVISGTVVTSVVAFWRADFRVLSVWILLCGAIAPLVLLGLLATVVSSPRGSASSRGAQVAHRVVSTLKIWTMPEVQLLAVLVAFIKLGSLVEVAIGPGLWCYAGMTLASLFAWRSYALAPSSRPAPDLAS